MEYITTLPKQIKGMDIAEVHSLAMSPADELYAGVATVRGGLTHAAHAVRVSPTGAATCLPSSRCGRCRLPK